MKKSTWYRDLLVMLAALCVAGVAVVWVQRITGRIDGVAMLIFMLAVFVTSMYTDGYLWGVLASLASVLAVNFAFFTPYFDDEDEHEHHHEHHYDEHGVCSCGHHHHHDHDADEVFTSWGKETAHKYSREDLDKALHALDEGAYGMILRAKGIVDGGDTWYEFDMVPGEHEIRPCGPDVTGKLCVIGSQLKEHEIAELFHV